MLICFIGDSFVNGTGDAACLGWTGRVCAAARQAGHDVTRYELGVRRDTSADVAARWRREADARLPDSRDGRLVFSFGTNDCTPGADGGTRVAHGSALANARAILSAARERWPSLMVGPPPVGDDPATDRRIAALSADIAALCTALQVPFLPVFDALATCEPWRREAARGDGSHPDAGGYAALAELVAGWDGWRGWFGGGE